MSARSRLLYVYAERVPAPLRDLVRSHLPSDRYDIREMTYDTPPEEQKSLLSQAEVVLFAPGRHLPDDVMEAARNVKLMQLWSSGYDKFNVDAARRFGIPVASNGGGNAISVAEHTLLLMQAVNRRLPDSHRRATTGAWAGNLHGLDMRLMYGKRVGLIGFGAIGREVARRCRAFRMEIVYSDPVAAPAEVEKELGAKAIALETLLETSDIVSLHVHLNAQTRLMINQDALARMKNDAVLINVSRAGLVDKQALIEALASGRLRGAGLDVFDEEPTRPDDPLLSLPGVVATHHIAGSTRDTYEMVLQACVENLDRAVSGQRPLWQVAT